MSGEALFSRHAVNGLENKGFTANLASQYNWQLNNDLVFPFNKKLIYFIPSQHTYFISKNSSMP